MSEIPNTNLAVHHFQPQNEPISPPPEFKNGSTETPVEFTKFDSMVAEISQFFDGIPVNDQRPKPVGNQPVNDQKPKPAGDQISLQNGNQTPSTLSCNRNPKPPARKSCVINRSTGKTKVQRLRSRKWKIGNK